MLTKLHAEVICNVFKFCGSQVDAKSIGSGGFIAVEHIAVYEPPQAHKTSV